VGSNLTIRFDYLILSKGGFVHPMTSPCANCEHSNRPKTQCTEAGNYCKKLLKYQMWLDMHEHPVRTVTHTVAEYSLAKSGKKGAHHYDPS